jgi:frataxin-like iron-binding protein CyaY
MPNDDFSKRLDDIFDVILSKLERVVNDSELKTKGERTYDEIITIRIDKWEDRFKAAMKLMNTGELRIRRRKK